MGSGESRLTRCIVNCLLVCACFLLFGGALPTYAQDTPTSLAALQAYRCTFDANTQTLQINAAVSDENGMSFEPNVYQLSAAIDGGASFAEDSVTFTSDAQRPPLRMVLVLDITDTVPINNIVSALSEDLIPRLQPLDELAMITFGDEVSPPTRFYSDKNRLINEYLVGLQTIGGDNRVYDAVMTAAELFPFDANTRKVVLLVTDSGLRSNIAQATSDEIISRASADGTQIYSIGFYSEDRPDAAELRTLAAGTRGFSWIYGETVNTPASIESAVRSYLQDFVQLLDSEITVSIDVKGVAPAANDQLPITLSANVAALGTLTSSITCPYEVVTYSIDFTGTISPLPIRGETDIGVVVSPSDDDTSVVFRVDGDVVQNSSETLYTLDPAQLAPGDHLIEAQLWNRNNETLAETDASLRVFSQQALDLSIAGQTTRNLSGTVEIQAAFNSEFSLPAIQLSIAHVSEPEATQSLGIMRNDSDSQASLVLDDIAGAVGALFPDLDAGESLQLVAVAPNTSAGEPPLAVSDPLVITLAPASVIGDSGSSGSGNTGTGGSSGNTETPTSLPLPQLAFENLSNNNAWILGTVFFGVLNLVLFLAVRKSRIRRLIAHADNNDLSPQLMSITVYRGGVPQSYTLTKKTLMIGRGSVNDINLGDDPNISRQHGVVMWRRNDWYYSNRKERLITRINRRRYRGLVFHRLEPMSEIQLGNVTMVFHSNAQQDISDFIKTDL